MSNVIRWPIAAPQGSTKTLRSLVKKFLNWSSDQQENRLRWQALALVVFGAILTPIIILVLSLTGINLFLILTAIVAMEVNLVITLLALPTKITIPVFLVGVIIDFAVIITCVFSRI